LVDRVDKDKDSKEVRHMTFTEAALEILKVEGRSMRSREIAEKAVDKGLLSHVGKTPVQTMSTRLSAAVAKGKGPFVRVRPGVFGLAEWGGNPPGPAKKEAAHTTSERRPETSPKRATAEPAKEPEKSATTKDVAEPAAPWKKKRRRRPTKADKPVRAPSSGQASAAAVSSTDRAPKGNTLPERKEAEQRGRPPTRETKSKPPERREAEQRGRPSTREIKGKPPAIKQPASAIPGNGELVEQFEAIMRSQTRPIPTAQLCDQAGIGFESGTILAEALLLSDGMHRELKGLRPKFIRHKGGFALAEREVSGEIISLAGQISDARDRLVRIVERQMLRKLRTLSMKAFVSIMVVYLQRTGFGAMKPIRRGGKGEFHMSVQDRRHEGRFRTAVVIRRDQADNHLSDEAVIDLRGSLHRYNSTSGIIATTGTVSDKAKTEATVPNLAPVALLSGEMLARDMVQFGVGVRDRTVKFPSFDKAFFSLLES
jgi:hypothetical protein